MADRASGWRSSVKTRQERPLPLPRIKGGAGVLPLLRRCCASALPGIRQWRMKDKFRKPTFSWHSARPQQRKRPASLMGGPALTPRGAHPLLRPEVGGSQGSRARSLYKTRSHPLIGTPQCRLTADTESMTISGHLHCRFCRFWHAGGVFTGTVWSAAFERILSTRNARMTNCRCECAMEHNLKYRLS